MRRSPRAPPPLLHHSSSLPLAPAPPPLQRPATDAPSCRRAAEEHRATAASACAPTAWRLGRPRRQMNFQDVHTLQQTLDVAPPPRLNSAQDRAEHTARQRRLLVAQEDERVMAEWRRRHPEDVAYEQVYWAQRREEDTRRRRDERLDRRRRKALASAHADLVAAGGRSFFTENDDRWLDIWLSTSDDTNDDDDGDDWSDWE
ncbi:hypothetical protein D1007_19026 [Hordeum vulgare]|nr:hypothetical protein D1007_19026 [Hordeum vulgare]